MRFENLVSWCGGWNVTCADHEMLLRCGFGVLGAFGVLGVLDLLRTCFATSKDWLAWDALMKFWCLIATLLQTSANYPCLIHFTRLPVEWTNHALFNHRMPKQIPLKKHKMHHLDFGVIFESFLHDFTLAISLLLPYFSWPCVLFFHFLFPSITLCKMTHRDSLWGTGARQHY